MTLRNVSSFMYDEEPKFQFKATQNVAHIEYSRSGLSLVFHQRCSLKNISRAGAIIEFIGSLEPPSVITLVIPDSKAGKIGCVRWSGTSSVHVHGKIALRLRFLKLLTEKQLANVLANSTLEGERREFSFFV